MYNYNNNKFTLTYDNVPFTGKIIRRALPEEISPIASPYTYYVVEFDTGNDKIYPRVMNIMTSIQPLTYKHIVCETEIKQPIQTF
jgi:hypothetical protein